MKLLKAILFFFILLTNFSSANEDGIEFNKLIAEFHDSSSYPFLENRDDIGIHYEFEWNEKNEKIIIKRNENNYPIIRFSLFEKNKLKPGDVIVQLDSIDLSSLKDQEIKLLEKQNKSINIKILGNDDLIFLEHKPYKLNNIKLSNFTLDSINNKDTTKGILEISFRADFTNERSELNKYAKNTLKDYQYHIEQELYDKNFQLPIEAVTLSEYKLDVDVRNGIHNNYLPMFSYDNGVVKTIRSEWGIGQFRQKFNFKKFPFDKQTLIINIKSGAHSESNTQVSWPKGFASVTFVTPDKGAFIGLKNYINNNFLSELGWSILDTDISSNVIINKNYYDYYLDKTFSRSENSIDLRMEIKRNSAHYLFKIIIPVFLILCVAWSVLWIPTYKLDARLTTSIVSLLSLIAYNFVFEGDIPKLDYLTDLDKYILLSYIYCCIPTFISIGFSRFIQRTTKMQRRVTKVNSHIRKWGGVIYLIITFQIFYSVN